MEILPGIKIIEKALWIRRKRVLIISDLHLGYEEALNKQGVFVPRMMFSEIKKEIKELIKLKPKIVVINGDLKHEFGEISRQEWRETLEILDLLLKQSKVILIKGNHDTIIGPIAEKRNLIVREFYCFDDVCVLHGHKIFLDKKIYDSKIIIIGHEHPAISIQEGVKKELFKCFLLGRWKNKKIIVMPSFFTVFEGSDLKKEKLLSPYLDEKNIGNFEVFIVGDKIYKFGKVQDI
jgi:putative SbcD/Mre11-related phosphoesterase